MERGRGEQGGRTAAVVAAEIERLKEENRRLYEHIGRIMHAAWLEEEAERTRQEAEEFQRQCEEAKRKDEESRVEAERIRREEAEKARRAAREAEEARVREEQRKRREAAEKEAREREAERSRREEEARRKADEARKAKEREAERQRKAAEEARRARMSDFERLCNRMWNLTPRQRYEEDWQNIAAGRVEDQFSFRSFPWPLLEKPDCHHEEEFPAAKIEKFLQLSELQTNAERCKAIRKELTRWHPDKFNTRVHSHLYSWDTHKVNGAAACVSRALVQLLEKFSRS